MSNDRIQQGDIENALPKPAVKIIVDGNEIVKPGMRTFFAQDERKKGSIVSGRKIETGGSPVSQVLTNTVCVCNEVCTCDAVPACSCNTYRAPSCSCNSHTSSSTYCSCNKICTCVPVY